MALPRLYKSSGFKGRLYAVYSFDLNSSLKVSIYPAQLWWKRPYYVDSTFPTNGSIEESTIYLKDLITRSASFVI